ncbi:MAG TPA: hypothetical protein PLE66_14205, partial [Thauera aminoaromatica]|nr:hypothetical protein [Thauera aminoaromatica]
ENPPAGTPSARFKSDRLLVKRVLTIRSSGRCAMKPRSAGHLHVERQLPSMLNGGIGSVLPVGRMEKPPFIVA